MPSKTMCIEHFSKKTEHQMDQMDPVTLYNNTVAQFKGSPL